MTEPLIHALLIILAAGLVAALICRRLQISVLVGYLLAGTLLGRGGLGWVTDQQHEVEILAEAGVFLLLFSIGVEFALEDLWRLGRHLLVGGSVQMLCVAVPVALLLAGQGMPWRSAGLVAAAVAFSSTVLVFKALAEWGQNNTRHGRRAVGILLFQDVALIPLLLLVPLLTGSETATGWQKYLLLAAVSLLFAVSVLLGRHLLAGWVIPWFARYRSPELVILFTLVSLGCVTLAAHLVGLPAAIGALAAGLIFNGNRWTKQIDALLLPFRETFSAIFFVSLGLLVDPRVVVQQPGLLLASLALLVVWKGAAAALALRLTGLTWRSSLGMGAGLAHVGEFAFVLLLAGWNAGLLSDADYQRAVTLALGSLLVTPLLLQRGLRFIETGPAPDEQLVPPSQLPPAPRQALVIGAGPIGRSVATQLETQGHDVCLVDLSPINLQPFAQQGFRTVAGDATQADILEHARAEQSPLAVVCVPDDAVAVSIVRQLRQQNRSSTLLVRCRFQSHVRNCLRAGATGVVSEEAQTTAAFLKILEDPRP